MKTYHQNLYEIERRIRVKQKIDLKKTSEVSDKCSICFVKFQGDSEVIGLDCD